MANLYNKTVKIICISFLFQASVYANEVVMFNDQPPSAEEIGNILFSNPSRKDKKVNALEASRTRSISFAKKDYQPAPNPALTEVASSSVGLPLQFSYNSSEISGKSIPFLDELGKMMNLENYRDKKLLIEGHTDASGSDQYNKILSEQRAQAVKSYLVDNYQISPEKLFITGQGESFPLLSTDPAAAINRRVQFYSAE